MEIARLVEKQKNFFLSGATLDYGYRREQLKKLKWVIQSNEDNIIEAVKSDFSKPPIETFESETQLSIDELNLFLKKTKTWMRPERVPSTLVNFPSSGYIINEPYGLSLIISPWNYPFQLCIVPLIGAIAAGNCAVLKPSELAPVTSRMLEKMINEHFPEQYIHVVNGDAETAKELLDQKFDFIFFTGSSKIGRVVAESAARTLTPTVLELGGKSPCIVDKNYPISLAAKRIAWGKFFNCGQTCIAPDYLYVHQEVHDQLIEQLIRTIRNFYGNNPKVSPDYARIININHFNRLKENMDPSKVICGGDLDPASRYISPTILDPITWDDPIMRDEIFGPILPVMTYHDIDEVIHQIRQKEKPLSLYLFTMNKQIQKEIVNHLSFGGGAINDTVSHFVNPNMPFGGVGLSGYGGYHGKFSFDTFSHRKSILKKGSWLDIPLRYPPYNSTKEKIIRLAYKLNINI
jgi:aldehyde dehydrogenase (NAD+)